MALFPVARPQPAPPHRLLGRRQLSAKGGRQLNFILFLKAVIVCVSELFLLLPQGLSLVVLLACMHAMPLRPSGCCWLPSCMTLVVRIAACTATTFAFLPSIRPSITSRNGAFTLSLSRSLTLRSLLLSRRRIHRRVTRTLIIQRADIRQALHAWHSDDADMYAEV